MVTHQKMIVFASSIGFTTPGNIAEHYSSKNRFKKFQISKIPTWHKEGVRNLHAVKNEFHVNIVHQNSACYCQHSRQRIFIISGVIKIAIFALLVNYGGFRLANDASTRMIIKSFRCPGLLYVHLRPRVARRAALHVQI